MSEKDATLLVDIGNSRVKSACWWRGIWYPMDTCRQCDISALAPPHELRLGSAWACNVAGPASAQRLQAWCSARGITLHWATSSQPLAGLEHSYASPAALGDDRWLAMAGARRHYPGPLCIIDCGTATTIDLLDADGRHCGGAILPGIASMRAALQYRTHDLPMADSMKLGHSSSVFASDTLGAIAGGTRYALAGAIDRIVAQVQMGQREGAQTALHCILTGGEANLVSPLLEGSYTRDGALVLKGLLVASGLK